MRHTANDGDIAPILDACLSSDREHLEQLVEHYNITYTGLDFFLDESRQNLLHILAAKPNFDKWDLILQCFVYQDATDAKLQTPLHIAIQNRNLRACKALIDNGASPVIEDDRGTNPIQLACQLNYVDVLDILYECYLTVKYLISNVHSMCRYCIDYNSVAAFQSIIGKLTIEQLSVYDEEGKALIHYASFSSNPQFLMSLLDKSDPPDKVIDINQKTIQGAQSFDKTDAVTDAGKTAIEITESIPCVEVLISRGARYNVKEPTQIIADVLSSRDKWKQTGRSIGPSKLHTAAHDGNANELNSFDGKVDIRDLYNKTPLMEAVERHQLKCIQTLLKKKANPNFYTERTSAYHVAAQLGYTEAIAEFRQTAPPDLSLRDCTGKTSVILAIESGIAACVEELVSGLTIEESDYNAAVDLLLKMKDDGAAGAMARALHAAGLKATHTVVASGRSFVCEAVVQRKHQLASVLIDIAALDSADLDALLVEAVTNECDVVQQLLKLGATPVMHRGRPLVHFTASHATRDALMALVKDPALKTATDTRGNTYLHRAAFVGNPRAIEDSFSILGLAANVVNSDGDTPLHILMHRGGPDFAQNYKMLVVNGGDPAALNFRKQNLLHVAAEFGNEEAIKLFLEGEGNLEEAKRMGSEKDDDGLTPLESALKASKLACAKMLTTLAEHPIFESKFTTEDVNSYLSRELSPDVCDAKGVCLLTHVVDAIEANGAAMTEETVRILLEAGADPSIEDANEETPLYHALNFQNKAIFGMLIDAGSSFLLGPGVNVICEEKDLPEFNAMSKKPHRRAFAAKEFTDTLRNTSNDLLATLQMLTPPFRELASIREFIPAIQKMERVCRMMSNRLTPIVARMKPTTCFGDLLLYFVDAFIGLVNISSLYCIAKADIDNSPNLVPLLEAKCELSRLHLNDTLIVPIQVMTRLPDLIQAILSNTPEDHPDVKPLQRAHMKFNAAGVETNERQLIFDSQKKLQELQMVLTIDGQLIRYTPNDVLAEYDQFTKLDYKEPPSGTELPPAAEWGLKQNEIAQGSMKVTYFRPLGTTMKSLLSAEHITVFLFRKFLLFGVLKNETSFKLKYSCRTSEALFDFSFKHGSDAFMVWTPIGQFHLKIFMKSGQPGEFPKQQWKKAVEKMNQARDIGETIGGREVVLVSWVGLKTNCVHSKQFCVRCGSREEAKKKIRDALDRQKVQIQTFVDSAEPLIIFTFLTYQPAQAQQSDVLASVEVK